ncbi:hypothetical protein B0H19DRAFT_1265332 [Mycena capillaripes]|nr:hypothetical protein B0H19DRAFT_1265332 [Mycena capillaripes]
MRTAHTETSRPLEPHSKGRSHVKTCRLFFPPLSLIKLHSTLTVVLGASNIIKLWPVGRFSSLTHLQAPDRNGGAASPLKSSSSTASINSTPLLPATIATKSRVKPINSSSQPSLASAGYSLHPQGREGLVGLALFVPRMGRDIGPKLKSATSHDVSLTRRGPRRVNPWEKEEDGLGTTLLCLRSLLIRGSPSPPFAGRVHASVVSKPHPSPYISLRRTQRVCPRTLYIAHIASQSSTCTTASCWTTATWVMQAFPVRALQFESPPEVLFRPITHAMREVGGGLLADDRSEGWDGTMNDVGLLNFYFL